MSLADHAGLKAAVTSWMADRADIADQFDDLLTLTEADLNRFLRVREMEATATLTPDSDGKATLPSDYMEWRAVISTNNPRRILKLIDPMMAETLYGYRESDLPEHFTIIGDTLQVLPVSTTDVSLLYYKTVPALTSSATTNWLLTKAPNIYLFGTCRYASAWLKETEDEGRFEARFMGEIERLTQDDKGQRYARAAVLSQGQRP